MGHRYGKCRVPMSQVKVDDEVNSWSGRNSNILPSYGHPPIKTGLLYNIMLKWLLKLMWAMCLLKFFTFCQHFHTFCDPLSTRSFLTILTFLHYIFVHLNLTKHLLSMTAPLHSDCRNLVSCAGKRAVNFLFISHVLQIQKVRITTPLME